MWDYGVRAYTSILHALQGAPHLKLLLLNTKSGNLWDDGQWMPAMVERLRKKGITVIQSAGHGTNGAAVEACLQEAFRDSPHILKYAAQYVF